MGLEDRRHRVAILRPRLAEYVMQSVRKGSHVLIEGSLISSTFERANGKGKKTGTEKTTSWSIRADSVHKLDRGEPEHEAATPSVAESSETRDAASF
jgi:single-stranded DNA-binding protein